MALSKAPVIASHSAARALADHSRNMDDEQLEALKKNGGVTGWNGAEETFNVTLELVRRGYTEEQIGKLWSGNLLRVMAEVEKVARQIQAGQK